MRYRSGQSRNRPDNPRDLIPLINSGDFTCEVLREEKTVLLLCMPRNEAFITQVEVVEFVSHTYGEKVKTCLVAEEFIPQFCHEYRVKGTPTYLLFSKGKEMDRILGCIDKETVSKFITEHLVSV